MAALLADIQPGDEVIVPSYTFVSTALAFVRQGARIVFADSSPGHPNMDAASLEALITPRTKAIVPVHYGGYACDMRTILAVARRYKLLVIADAAQAIDAYYTADPARGAIRGTSGSRRCGTNCRWAGWVIWAVSPFTRPRTSSAARAACS